MSLTTINLGAPEPMVLARFYERLLGWTVDEDSADETWVVVRPPQPGVAISCQLEEAHVAPVWPALEGDQQMQLHLEVGVDDLNGALEHALASGAELAQYQPQDDVRVCLDPAGHPFCLWLRE
ncbi:VOC family protein [Angustibacter sp. McL0619]|uniref:VOC family protein n=1 Tax=Angustibacter sp. McL0619 TaxID=3415676 RepID=UPI003CF742A9